MRAGLVVAVVVTAGCRQILGIDDVDRATDAAARDGAPDGTVADADPDAPDAAGVRTTRGLVAQYRADEGGGVLLADDAPVAPALELTISDVAAVAWGAGTVTATAPVTATQLQPAAKIHDACVAADELTIEAWITAADTVQSNSRVIVLGADGATQSFYLAQQNERWQVRYRSGGSNRNLDASGTSVSTTLQHVVAAIGAAGSELVIDGAIEDSDLVTASFTDWDAAARLAMFNSPTDDRPWRGTVHLVAIYCAKLTPSEIATNHAAGAEAP